jgi:hypothetical protein
MGFLGAIAFDAAIGEIKRAAINDGYGGNDAFRAMRV